MTVDREQELLLSKETDLKTRIPHSARVASRLIVFAISQHLSLCSPVAPRICDPLLLETL